MRLAMTKGIGWRLVTVVLALAVLMSLWASLMAHNLARGEALFALVTEQQARNRMALSADFLEYRDYYRAFPERFSAMTADNTFVEYYKRPLYGPVSATLSIVVGRVFGVTYPANLYVVLSFYAALATVLLFALCRSVPLPALESTLLAAAGALSFAWLSVFTVPESYSLSVCAALGAALSGSRLPPLDGGGGLRATMRHAAISGMASWVYLPAAGAVLLLASRLSRRRQWLTLGVPAIALSGLLAFLPQVLPRVGALQLQVEYATRWTSATHFLDPSVLAQVGAAFLVFGLVAPVGDYLTASATADIAAATRRVWTVVGAALLLTVYAALTWRLARRATVKRVSGALLWLVGLYCFHVWYNPGEVLLYLSVPVAVLLYVLAICVHTCYELAGAQAQSVRTRVVRVMWLVPIVLLVANWSAVV